MPFSADHEGDRDGDSCDGRASMVPLRERDFDALGLERLADHAVELAPEDTRCRRIPSCPDAQHEMEGAVPEFLQEGVRFRVLQHTGMPIGGLEEQPLDQFRIRPIRHPDRKIESHVPVHIAPVGHSAGHEVGVRNDDGDVVVGDDGRRPQ
jgi:hypothetical protein